jgi:hypothetical protein
MLEKQKTGMPENKPLWGCADFCVLGIVWLMSLVIRFNCFTLFFPLLVILLLVFNFRFSRIPTKFVQPILFAVFLLFVFSPIDIVFRPGSNFTIKFLSVFECHGAYGHVRRCIFEGKQENVDFIVRTSGCSGPTYPPYAITILYPSRYTTHFGRLVTPAEAEKRIQQTRKDMAEWYQKEVQRRDETNSLQIDNSEQ